MTYSSLKFAVFAEIDDQVIDVAQFSCSYELNRIPKATLVLPVGREPRTGMLAASHNLAAIVSIQTPIKVYVDVAHGAGLGNTHAIVPQGRFLLFDGYVTGVGYKRHGAGLSIAFELTHWLSDLSFSSTLSASSHPGNPYSFFFNSSATSPTSDVAGGGTGGGALLNWVGKTMAQALATEADVRADLWGKVILPWFIGLTKADRLLIQPEAFGPDVAANDSKNKEAASALQRFDGDKLEMDTPSEELSIIAKLILEDIAVTSNSGTSNNHFLAMANTTIWDKLVGDLAQTYMFSIVPYPSKAKVVPFIGGLRETFNSRNDVCTIMARDITSMELQTYIPRPLRAVGVLGGHTNASGADISGGTTMPTLKDVSGMFVGRDEGLVIYKMAPRWASEIGVPWINTASTAGISTARGSAFHPRAGSKPTVGTAEELMTRRKNFTTILDKYARALYAQEVLRNRNGQLSGALRFDIAPGSTVSIQGQGDTFNEDEVIDVRYASVFRVTYYFDAEEKTVGTSFQLGNIRTELENEEDSTSIDKHPLYTNIWTGDELVEAE